MPLAFVLLLLAPGGEPLARLTGADFTGGAAELFGGVQQGRARTNFVYAAPNAERSRMTAHFTCEPADGLSLFLYARRDDWDTACPIRVSLNGAALLAGSGLFASDRWEWRSVAIPDGLLRSGGNELLVENLSPEGIVGMPPWFLLSLAVVAPSEWTPTTRPPLAQDFRIELPERTMPFPTPLGVDHPRPGFALRGIKGWMWSPAQYLDVIPTLRRARMNFLMNCYGSMCDIEHHPWGDPDCNRWWEPLPAEKLAAYAEVVRACEAHGIDFCFSLNPNIGARRLLRYDSDDDFAIVLAHYRAFQGMGVRWFDIQFDDITGGIDAAGQARFTNRLLAALRERDPGAEMIFCPVYYWGTGEEPDARLYLETLARELDPSIRVFWTGDGVVGRITREAAESYRRVVDHPLFVWDNYPVNDGASTLHLGPVLFRDPDLCEAADGYLANPMFPQHEASLLPLLTAADYAWNPWEYDPARSIGQAIRHLARTEDQRLVLRDLVELYPGMLLFGKGTGWNPAVARLAEIASEPHARFTAEAFVSHVEELLARLDRAFPDRFRDARQTLADNLAAMRRSLAAAYDGP